MKLRMGCLNGSGLVAMLLVLIVFFIAVGFRGGLLFSPGPLNAVAGAQTLGGVKSHAETGGKCAACHAAPWSRQQMAARCEVCHTDLVQDPKNFHNLMLTEAKITGTCLGCHTDHHGPQASLTKADLQNFNHNLLGFSLQAHQKNKDGSSFACSECHVNGYLQKAGTACQDCHTKLDAVFTSTHQAAYGTGCLDCHDGKETYGHAFNHQNASFKLTGKHAALKCADCHTGARTIADLKATPQDCFSCHAKNDTHQGRLGQDCGNCHTPDGWSPAKFDHNLATFKLTGKHASVACEACHVNNVFQGTPQDCISCHSKDDVHQGELGSCVTCHTTDGWSPANFDHSLAVFQLTGKHADVACNQCHTDFLYKNTPQSCFYCHAKDDPHQGQLGNLCDQCHTPNGWSPSTFDHSTAAFQLIGKHANVPCNGCHQDMLFKNTPQNCYACHAKDDAHNGQFGQDCGLCHSPTGWLPATFDHSKSGFPLTGAHASLACTACHTGGNFTNLSTACNSCHGEPAYHRGLFGFNCASCHNTSAWIPAQFNGSHTFPMGHGGAGSCHSCHPNTLSSFTCFTCHDQAQTVANHQNNGITGLGNCIGCHPTGQTGDSGGGGGG